MTVARRGLASVRHEMHLLSAGEQAPSESTCDPLIERGEANPTWETVKGIAAALGVAVSELAKAAERLERLVAKAPVRDLVDAFGVRLAGMVADAESDVAQLGAIGDDLQLKHHPEPPGRRRQINLEAMR